ncbi:isochorismatase family protein [Burkholderia ambifaria]|uniref:isochorismatase family protein n=1 Tax=Burkholderia ambifaria TaxID=152480 RepID=UPI00158CAE2C|nr:isochorismatase family protein [Burkholderia ambifaria]WDR91052.1 isochorismatase family protein [Burkholderia ambifaria]WDS03963.1 isochorismatase family protein [Burkholderia ambifaria]
MLHVPDDSVLVLVDFQTRLMPAIHDGASVAAQAVRLGWIARIFEVPVIGTEQSPLRLGESVSEIKGLCSDTVAKDHFDACTDGLADALPAERTSVIVAGCEAHVCVLQTAFGLLRSGRKVTVVSDAVGSRKTIDREAAIGRLGANGVEIATVEMIAFEWLGSSRHPRFRDVLQLIK